VSTGAPTLVVLAAGMGSRYGGIKQIDPVGLGGETIIDFSIYDAIRSGFAKVVFVIRREIEKDFREVVGTRYEQRIAVAYAFQSMDDLPAGFAVPAGRAKPWGTGHAVHAARGAVAGSFAVINADDYYGGAALRAIADRLGTTAPESRDYAMVGYRLRNTLSEHGTVSRGLCSVGAGGFLAGMEEHTKIEKKGRGAVSHRADGSTVELSGEETVSMNLFGFAPSIFPLLERELTTFLRGGGTDPKAEFYIPLVVNRLVAAGDARMSVLATDAQWFGVTYREDRPIVRDAIAAMQRAGTYPVGTWEHL
jgi:hypothetical protein